MLNVDYQHIKSCRTRKSIEWASKFLKMWMLLKICEFLYCKQKRSTKSNVWKKNRLKPVKKKLLEIYFRHTTFLHLTLNSHITIELRILADIHRSVTLTTFWKMTAKNHFFCHLLKLSVKKDYKGSFKKHEEFS